MPFYSSTTKEIAVFFKIYPILGTLLQDSYEVDASAERNDAAAKLFSLSKYSLQMEIIDLQEDFSLQMYELQNFG